MRKIFVMALLGALCLSGSALAQGAYCREYTKTIRVEGEWQQAYGTACMQPDGSWEVVDGNAGYDEGYQVSGADYAPRYAERRIIVREPVYAAPYFGFFAFNVPRYYGRDHAHREYGRHGGGNDRHRHH